MKQACLGTGIRVERSGRIATVWLDSQAKRNAFDASMLRALTNAAAELVHDRDVTAVVLRGAGHAFSAGADFDAFVAGDEAAFADRFGIMERALDEAVAALLALPQPLVAAIEGACFGGAVQLALCADIRMANEAMRLAIPAASIGIVYPLDAIERLIALAGPGVAKLILMTGRPLSAADCLRVGIVEMVAPDAGFDAAMDELCARLGRQSKAAVRAYKQIVDGFFERRDRASMGVLQDSVNSSTDTWQRISAAIAQRKPRDRS